MSADRSSMASEGPDTIVAADIPAIAVLPSTPTLELARNRSPYLAGTPSPSPSSRKHSTKDSREGTPILSIGKDAVKGVLLSKHSFATIGKRKNFSRKPSSWRHPGGTVSETEETDFSEYETDGEGGKPGREDKKAPRHVHSFTFSSLSRFRTKNSEKSSKEDVSRQNSQDEETRVDKIEVPRITSPSRSPNRKLREATDRVGDKLRAYAQKFKESKERDKDRLEGKRSSSTGRTDTIQEESTEEIEADRIGISRTQSLITRTNRKADFKALSPLDVKKFKGKKWRQSSEEGPPSPSSSEISTATPKFIQELAFDKSEVQADLHDQEVIKKDRSKSPRDIKRALTPTKGKSPVMGKSPERRRSGLLSEADSVGTVSPRRRLSPKPPSEVEMGAVCYPICEEIPTVLVSEIVPVPSHINRVDLYDSSDKEEEVLDDLMPRLDPIKRRSLPSPSPHSDGRRGRLSPSPGADAKRKSLPSPPVTVSDMKKGQLPSPPALELNEMLLKQLILGGASSIGHGHQDPSVDRYRKCVSQTPEPCSSERLHHIPPVSDKSDRVYMQQPTSGFKPSKHHHRRSGHGSRPGSKKKRKKDQFQESRHLHKSEEKDIVLPKFSGPVRSASLNSLGTGSTVNKTSEEARANLSLSPGSQKRTKRGPRLLGSSTLPRSSSQNRSQEDSSEENTAVPSVLSLQLEGAYAGQTLSESSTWREDTLSPSTTRSTVCSGFTGESTETLMNVEDCLLEPCYRKLSDPNPPRSQLLFPDLMKAEEDIAEASETEETQVMVPQAEDVQSDIKMEDNWVLTPQAVEHISENNRIRLEEDQVAGDLANETVELLQDQLPLAMLGQHAGHIKVAQVMEMQGEAAEEAGEESGAISSQDESGKQTADMVDVGCDAEVAQLTCRKSYEPNVYGDQREVEDEGGGGEGEGGAEVAAGDIKLVVQSYGAPTEILNQDLLTSDLLTSDLNWEDSWPTHLLTTGAVKSVESSNSASPWGKAGEMASKHDHEATWTQGPEWQDKFFIERVTSKDKFFIERVPSKDTDSTCSLTLSQGEQSEDSSTSVSYGKPSLAESKNWPQAFSPQSAATWARLANQKLGPDMWQHLNVQSPENTIFSASTIKTKERNTILEMEWAPQPEKVKRSDWSSQEEKRSDWSSQEEKRSHWSQDENRCDWSSQGEKPSDWSEKGDSSDDWVMPSQHQTSTKKQTTYMKKAATFPRISSKTMSSADAMSQEESRDSEYSAGKSQGEMKKKQFLHAAADDNKYGKMSSSSPAPQLYRKVYKTSHESKGFKLPEGFVTPVRTTPNRNISANQLSKRISTRQALRGPFGELLMEEMSKPSSLLSRTSNYPSGSSVPICAPCPVTTQMPIQSIISQQVLTSRTDSDSSLVSSAENIITGPSTKMGGAATGLLQTTACLLSTAAHTTAICAAKHQRTRSSPSRIEYENLGLVAPADLTTQLITVNSSGETVEGGQIAPRVGKDLLINRIEQGGTSAFRVIKVTQQDTRALIVREVLQVEKSYVESLQILIMKYMNPLKNPANAFSIEPNLVDDIFYQIPTILEHHEGFLEDLKTRLENWNPNQTIGDWFIESFSKKSVLETYTSFIRNVKRADDGIRLARSLKPAFDRFLQDMRRERRGERLSLSDLLAKPHQRIPRYRLLIQRLLKSTDPGHEDYALLQQAERQIHELALKISTIEKEATEQEVRQGILRQLEVLVHGLGPGDLANPHRTLIRQDIVTSSTTTWIRKERCLFLLTDLLLITTINRRGTRSSKEGKKSYAGMNNLNQILETCRHKLWMYLSIKDVEIGRDDLKKGCKDSGDIEEDIKVLNNISEQLCRLSNPHRDIEDMVKSSMVNLQKQLLDRQSLDPGSASSQANCLNLSIHTDEGPETIGLVFESCQTKLDWEEEFTKCKEKFEIQADPPPNLLTLIPIRKTRAGLQFTSAAPTLNLNSHGLKDVWVCNSDGYVGQVCVLSVRPEPSVICCNGVCNARIQSIASVPGESLDSLDCSRYSSLRKDWAPSWSAPTTPASLGWVTPPASVSGGTGSTSGDWASKSWNSETGTADSSPRSGAGLGHMLDISSEDEDDGLQTSQFIPRADQSIATMWLGTEDGTIHVYNCTDNIRLKKNKEKFFHSAPVVHILYHDAKVYVSLGNGEVIIYSRDSSGMWDKSGCVIKSVGTVTYPVTRMSVVLGAVWCATHNTIKRLDPVNHTVQDITTLNADPRKSIVCMELSGLGLWIVQQGSAVVHLYNIKSRAYLLELNVVSTVTKLLSGCDEIIRQHKTACLRVTTILAVKETLWVGTSAGAIVTATLPQLTETTTKLSTIPQITGVPHGHTGHVRFLTSVEVGGAASCKMEDNSSDDVTSPNSTKSAKETKKDTVGLSGSVPSQVLVISGGDGYEDFTNTNVNDMAGREDSTNHLLLWSI